jgi:hypothetical protein
MSTRYYNEILKPCLDQFEAIQAPTTAILGDPLLPDPRDLQGDVVESSTALIFNGQASRSWTIAGWDLS